MVLGVSNSFGAADALDYLRTHGDGLTARYRSASNGMSIVHDGTRWTILDAANVVVASIESTNPFPNAIEKASEWTLADGQSADYLSVHCEIPGKNELYSRMRREFAECSADEALNGSDFNNRHFEAVMGRDGEEWSFGLDGDSRHFSWNWTDAEGEHSVKVPSVGIGTAGIANDREVIEWAMASGYELIDSASDHAPWYQNEHIIGDLLRRGQLKRNEFMVTTKLYAKDQGMAAVRGLDDSLEALGVDRIDIYLIHHPHCDQAQCDGTWKTSWRVIEDYYFENKIQFVGASNFNVAELHELLSWTRCGLSFPVCFECL